MFSIRNALKLENELSAVKKHAVFLQFLDNETHNSRKNIYK